MNFLELCHRLADEVDEAGNGPVTVEDQRDDYKRLVLWIRDAWTDIQAMRSDWQFMRASGSIPVASGQSTAILPTDFDQWDRDTLRFGDACLKAVSWPDFNRARYPTTGSPVIAAIGIDGDIHLAPTPEAPGDLTFDYWKQPQLLKLDEDEPWLPQKHQMTIVHQAAIQYGMHHNQAHIVQRATARLQQQLNQMSITELPRMTLAGSFV